ncbi:MAG: hypothetical protein ACLU4J_18230 [Butyricimonas paravirosa]
MGMKEDRTRVYSTGMLNMSLWNDTWYAMSRGIKTMNATRKVLFRHISVKEYRVINQS